VADTAAGAGPLPSRSLVLRLPAGTSLTPGAKYRIVVRGIRNVVGLAGDAQVELTAPTPPPAAGAAPPPPSPDPNPNAH
jgi:hypothetical protein